MQNSGLWRELVRRGAQTFFPATCAACRRHVVQPGALCGSCWPKLHLLEPPWCAVLGTRFTTDMGSRCGFAGRDRRSAALRPFACGGILHGSRARSRPCPEVSGPARPGALDGSLDASGSLRAHPADRSRRARPSASRSLLLATFHQSAELARALSQQVRLPYSADVLLRRQATRRQVGLHANEREANVRRPSRCRKTGGSRCTARGSCSSTTS